MALNSRNNNVRWICLVLATSVLNQVTAGVIDRPVEGEDFTQAKQQKSLDRDAAEEGELGKWISAYSDASTLDDYVKLAQLLTYLHRGEELSYNQADPQMLDLLPFFEPNLKSNQWKTGSREARSEGALTSLTSRFLDRHAMNQLMNHWMKANASPLDCVGRKLIQGLTLTFAQTLCEKRK